MPKQVFYLIHFTQKSILNLILLTNNFVKKQFCKVIQDNEVENFKTEATKIKNLSPILKSLISNKFNSFHFEKIRFIQFVECQEIIMTFADQTKIQKLLKIY